MNCALNPPSAKIHRDERDAAPFDPRACSRFKDTHDSCIVIRFQDAIPNSWHQNCEIILTMNKVDLNLFPILLALDDEVERQPRGAGARHEPTRRERGVRKAAATRPPIVWQTVLLWQCYVLRKWR